MKDKGLKYDFTYYPNTRNTIRWGIQSTYHTYSPGKFIIDFTNEKTKAVTHEEVKLTESQGLEHGVFVLNEQEITDRLSTEYGIRASGFQSIGPSTWYETNSKHAVVDTHKFAKYEFYNSDWGLEPRLRVRYKTGQNSSVKASYNHTIQYVQIASNTIGGSPLDVWFPASKLVKPQVSDLFVLGYFKNIRQNMFELSMEVYYKMLANQIDFRDNANLLGNQFLESELRFGKGEAYGVETQINKRTGKVTGWISYTWSRSWRTFKDINDGVRYQALNDRPHNLSLVLNYEATKRLTLSAMFIYVTGSPATLPTGRYKIQNQLVPVYSSKNAARLPDYHRADIAATWKCKEYAGRKYFWDLNVSVYNIYNRKNAFVMSFENDKENPNKMKTIQTSIFPIIPSVTYNFRF